MADRILIHCGMDSPLAPAAFALARTLRAADCATRVVAPERAAPVRGGRAAYASAIAGPDPRAVVAFDGGDTAFLDAIADLGWGRALVMAMSGPLSTERTILLDDGSPNARRVAPDAAGLAALADWRGRHLEARLAPGIETRPGRLLVLLQADNDPALAVSPFRTMQAFVQYLEGMVPRGLEVALRFEPRAAYCLLTTDRPDFRFEVAGRLHDRIAEAEIVAGVNGPGLTEAVLMGKPVVAFGPGPYSGSDAVTEIARGEPFPQTVKVDAPARDAFLHDLIFRRLLDVDRLAAADVAHLVARRPFSNWRAG